MSLGGNFSSWQTANVLRGTVQCSTTRPVIDICPGNNCKAAAIQATTVYPSMLLESKPCPVPTPSQLALYPKAASTSSTLTAARMTAVTSVNQRFSQYVRYTPPPPCVDSPPPPASLPTSRQCPLYEIKTN